MDFPVKVFLDTNVFDSLHYDLSGKRFRSLQRLIDEGLVSLYLSEVVIGEAKRHIERNIIDVRNALKAPFKKDLSKQGYESRATGEQALRIISSSDKHAFIFQLLDKSLAGEMVNEGIALFEMFVSKTKATIIDSQGVDVSAIVADYFAPKPPFEGSKEKKSEFPDAFMMAKIKLFSEQHGKVFIVSDDDAFKHLEKYGQIKVFDNLHEFILFVNPNEDWIIPVQTYLSDATNIGAVHALIRDKIEELNPFIEGRNFDRKGLFNGVEYDETEVAKVSDISFEFVSVDSIEGSSALVTLNCAAKITADCTYFDETNSIWDSEDKHYIYRKYGRAEEIHHVEFESIIKLEIDETQVIDCDTIEFDLTLGQYTRESQYFLTDDDIEAYRYARQQSAMEDAEADMMDTLEDYHRH